MGKNTESAPRLVQEGGDRQRWVAHLLREFIPPSQTFVLDKLLFSRSRPLVIASQVSRPEGLPNGEILQVPVPVRWRRLWRQTRARVFHCDPYYQPVIQSFGVAVMHAHFGPTAVDHLPLKRATRLPLVTSFYGYDASRLLRNVRYVRRLGQLFKVGDRFLVVSRTMGERLARIGCPPDRTCVHHLGVDVDSVPCPDRRPRRGAVRALFVGRFVEKKGLEYALHAFAGLRDQREVEFRIVGDGPLRASAQTLARELRVADRCRFLGWLSRSAILHELETADVFLAPSVTALDGDEEGTPTTVIEAQAAGLPVVATYHAGIPEVVTDGETGYLVPERDPEALRDRLVALCSNPHLRHEFGTKGRQKMREGFDAPRLAAELERIYHELVG